MISIFQIQCANDGKISCKSALIQDNIKLIEKYQSKDAFHFVLNLSKRITSFQRCYQNSAGGLKILDVFRSESLDFHSLQKFISQMLNFNEKRNICLILYDSLASDSSTYRLNKLSGILWDPQGTLKESDLPDIPDKEEILTTINYLQNNLSKGELYSVQEIHKITSDPYSIFKSAENFYENGDFEKALLLYLLVRDHPGVKKYADHKIGEIYRNKGQMEKAIEFYLSSDMYPYNISRIIEYYWDKGDKKSAAPYLERVYNDKDFKYPPSVYICLAEYLRNQGKIEEAERIRRKLKSVD
ncbi:MAG: tetratricopeptide repeat protein [Candidatus Aminicenantaceae bacterium]